MSVTVIVGEQRGDEGKGRYVDMFMPEHDIGARFNGGANAGHTVVCDDQVYKLHGLPTSIVHPDKKSVIGNGAVINPVTLVNEIDTLASQGVQIDENNLLISSAAHLTLPSYIYDDVIRENGARAQGSTKSGIAPTYSNKSSRYSLQAHKINNDPKLLFDTVIDSLREQRDDRKKAGLDDIDEYEVAKTYYRAAMRLGPLVTDTTLMINRAINDGEKVLAEGAQAFLLDIDHGMYPFVTSSTTTTGGVATGLGIPPKKIDTTIGVVKAVQSHVGGGPFVTEITNPKELESLHGDMDTVDAEKGTTTGRVRRLGYLDLAQIKRAHMVNGTDVMAINKVDWAPRFGPLIPVCVAYERKGKTLDTAPDAEGKLVESTPIYEYLPSWNRDISDVRRFKDLPKKAKAYIKFIEQVTGVPVGYIGVGPHRDQVIVR